MGISTRLRKQLLSIVILLSAITAFPVETAAQLMSGKEFLVALPSFWRRADGGNPGNFQITIMCSRRTNITVRWSGDGGGLIDQGTIAAGNRLTIQPPRFPVVNLMQEFEDRKPFEVNERTFYVEADQPVSVFALYSDYRANIGSFTEMYAVPPLESYDTAYMNLTYAGYLGKNTGFLILAKEDGTEVTFDPSVDWNVPGEPAGMPVTMSLDQYQVYQVLSFSRGSAGVSDLSGTPITSNKPIGIIPFSLQTNVHLLEPVDTTNDFQFSWRTSPVADALPPEAKGGTRFYTAPMGAQDSSQVRVVALEDGTRLSVNGIQVATLDRSERHDISVGDATKIESTNPVVAMQISRSGNNPIRDTIITINPSEPDERDTIMPIFGNPAMAWLPPVSEYKRTLQWTNPLLDHHWTPIQGKDSILLYPWHHYALVTAPVSALNSVRIDGRSIDFQYRHIDGQYASAVVPILPKQHILTADAPVSCIAYGFAWDDAYAFVSGEALRSIGLVDVDSLVETTCDSTLEVSFKLSNVGNNNYRIDSIDADGIEIRSVRSPIGFPIEMPPGRELQARIVLKLSQPRTYTGRIRIYTDAHNRNVIEVPFRIIRDSARISIVTDVDFGQIAAEKTEADTLITITNDGENPVEITDLLFDDPRFEVTQPSLPLTIPSGGSRSIGVRLTPRPGVPERGRLRILGKPCFASIDVNFSGFQGVGPLLDIPRSIQFPSYLCDAPEFVDTIIVISSIGDEPTVLEGATIGGSDRDKFSIQKNPAPGTILPRKSDTIVVRYRPDAFGLHQAVLILNTNAKNVTDPLSITLRGRRDTAMVLPNKRTIDDFGQLLSCDDPVYVELRLSNNGTIDATIDSLELGDGVPFSADLATPFIIAPAGSYRTLTIRFAPTEDGEYNETLRIIGKPCGIAEEITLIGSRVSPSLISDVENLSLDTVYLCETSTSGTFTLRNNGPVTDTITRYTPGGDAAFALENVSYPVILEPGQSREFRVTFTPEAKGDFGGTLEFFWGPCNGSTLVNLNAVAVDPDVTLSATSMNFGQIDITTGMPGRQTITLTNEGNVPRRIASIDLGRDASLGLVQPDSFPVIIPAGGSLDVEVEYSPTEIGPLSTTAMVTVEGPCPEEESFAIEGEAIGDKVIRASMTITVPDNLTGQVDELVSIPILLSNGANLDDIIQLSLRLRWRYTMLLPLSIQTDLSGLTSAQLFNNTIEGDRRIVTVVFTGTALPKNGTLGTIQACALLGNRIETDITIDTVTLLTTADRELTYTTEHGKFTLLGLCELDGDRLVHLGGGLKISAPRPNPVSELSEIDFTTEGDRYVELVLYDALGIERERLYAGYLDDGAYTVQLDGRDLPTGLYFCELRQGAHRVRQTILIQ